MPLSLKKKGTKQPSNPEGRMLYEMGQALQDAARQIDPDDVISNHGIRLVRDTLADLEQWIDRNLD